MSKNELQRDKIQVDEIEVFQGAKIILGSVASYSNPPAEYADNDLITYYAASQLFGSTSNKKTYSYNSNNSYFSWNNLTYDLVFTFAADTVALFPYDPDNDTLEARLRQYSGNGTKSLNSFEANIQNDGTSYTTVTFEGVTDPNNLEILLS